MGIVERWGNEKSRAKAVEEERARLLAELDEEDHRLLVALGEELAQPPIAPYRYDLRSRIPRPNVRPPRSG